MTVPGSGGETIRAAAGNVGDVIALVGDEIPYRRAAAVRQEGRASLDRLLAALAAAEEAREQATAELRASERLAVSEVERMTKLTQRAKRAEAERDRAQEALREAREFIVAARPLLGIGLGNSLGARADALYVKLGEAAAGGREPTLTEPEQLRGAKTAVLPVEHLPRAAAGLSAGEPQP